MDDRILLGKRSSAFMGVLGLAMVLVVTISAFFLDRLPIIGAGTKYTAEFSEAAGIKKGNEVRIAGVKVGSVADVRLAGDRVLVDFRTQNAWIGNDTTAPSSDTAGFGLKFLRSLDQERTEMLLTTGLDFSAEVLDKHLASTNYRVELSLER